MAIRTLPLPLDPAIQLGPARSFLLTARTGTLCGCAAIYAALAYLVFTPTSGRELVADGLVALAVGVCPVALLLLAPFRPTYR